MSCAVFEVVGNTLIACKCAHKDDYICSRLLVILAQWTLQKLLEINCDKTINFIVVCMISDYNVMRGDTSKAHLQFFSLTEKDPYGRRSGRSVDDINFC